ncbi:Rv3235 family protein [Geodermatophilus amargosae]|uniref:Rv3235 family protein n=1 Tax=Geodermatophilus amargosae TaxID=1296565 RepID=UPI0034DE8B3C
MTASPQPGTSAAPAEAPAAPLRTLRLSIVPALHPPLTGPAVALVDPATPPPRPPHRPGPRPAPEGRRTRSRDLFGPAWSVRADLPDPRAAGRLLVTTALEALAGLRPLTQVQRLTSPGVHAALVSGRRPAWCAAGTGPLLVGPVHVCEPVDGVAEVSTVARRSGRAHAVAARLEGVDGRWRCTALSIG